MRCSCRPPPTSASRTAGNLSEASMMLVTVRNHINTQWYRDRADGAEMIMPECTEPAASGRRHWSRYPAASRCRGR